MCGRGIDDAGRVVTFQQRDSFLGMRFAFRFQKVTSVFGIDFSAA
jgi:hypothetical protein